MEYGDWRGLLFLSAVSAETGRILYLFILYPDGGIYGFVFTGLHIVFGKIICFCTAPLCFIGQCFFAAKILQKSVTKKIKL